MVEIFSSEFIIEEINAYNPLRTESTKTKLLLNVEPGSDDADSIESSTALGLANLASDGE